jgi:hypothetical protein
MLAASDGGTTVALLVALYFLPSIVAYSRSHRQAGAITVLNLLLGWTVLGWILAMVWAATAVNKPQPIIPQRNEALARAQARLASLGAVSAPPTPKRSGVNGVLAAISGFAVAMLLLILADVYFNAGNDVQFVRDKLQSNMAVMQEGKLKIADKLKPEMAVESITVEPGAPFTLAKSKKPSQK